MYIHVTEFDLVVLIIMAINIYKKDLGFGNVVAWVFENNFSNNGILY